MRLEMTQLKKQEPSNTDRAYETFIAHVRKELDDYRKTDPKVRVFVRLDLIPLFNPVTKTYRNVENQERLGWFVYLCNNNDYVYTSHRINVDIDVISQIVSLIHVS